MRPETTFGVLVLHVLFFELRTVHGQDTKFATDCMTPNRVQGLCVEIRNCKKLLEQVIQGNAETFDFIRASRCGPANEDASRPKVCCGPDVNYVNENEKEESCTTPNGERARCVLLKSCKIFFDYIQSSVNDPEQNRYLSSSLCRHDYQGPVVCCGSDTRFKNSLPGRDECGYQLDFKVLGGENTDLAEFPWLALLEQTKTSGTKSFGCGGSLINERYVLTAAHCVTSDKSKVTMVRLGEWNLDTEEDCVVTGSYKSCSPPPQDVRVESIIPHPNYEKSNRGVFNDIALIRLANPVKYNNFVKPICLPLPHERSAVGERPIVTGWGATETGKASPIKQKLGVPVTDLESCKKIYAQYNKVINEKMVCAGGEKGKDSCKGDSGGPLLGKTASVDDQFYIEGIVSYGAICGTEGFPAIYTRVSDHLDWIKQNVKP